ncbi:MAG: hypothetical protein V1928_03000 [Parcubacteria group bacterium]
MNARKYGWVLSLIMLASMILLDLFGDLLRVDWGPTDLDAMIDCVHFSFYFVMGAAFVAFSVNLLRALRIKQAKR